MAKPVVEIILKATDQASKVFKSTGKEASNMGKDIAKMGVAFAGTAVAAVAAGKQIFEFGKSGAAVIQTAESFDLLLEKVGAAPDLLEDLKDASRGTISEMELMSSTSLLLAGASGELATSLADSTPELLEIAKAAQKLNPALGDTTFLYDSLARGIKRASPLILDNLGLVISVGDANEKYAASIGKTVDQLTAEEQKMALLNDTLRAGKVLIDQVGGSTESASDSFERLEASMKDLADTTKTLVTPAIEPTVGILANFAKQLLAVRLESGKMNKELIKTTDSYDEYIFAGTNALVLQGEMNLLTAIAISNRISQGEAIDDLIIGTELLTGAEHENIQAFNRAIEVADEVSRGYGLLSDENIRLSETARLVTENFGYIADGISTLKGPIDELGATYDYAGTRASMLGEAIRITSENMEEAERKKLALRLATEDLTNAERLQLIEQQQELERVQQLLEAVDKGTISWEEFAKATDDNVTTQEELNEALGLSEDAAGAADPILDSLAGTMTILEEEAGDAAWQTKQLVQWIQMLKSKDITLSVNFDVGAMPGSFRPIGIPVGPGVGGGPGFGGPGRSRPTPGGTPIGGGGSVGFESVAAPVSITQNFFDEGAAAIGMAEIERISAGQFNSFMGG